MVYALHSLATHTYGAAAIVYLVYLIRQRRALAGIGRALVGLGVTAHAAGLALLFVGQGAPIGMAQAFSSLAFLLVAIFLGLDLRYRLPVLGAFLTPFALALLVPGLLIGRSGVFLEAVRGPLLPLHITVALLGLAATAVAAGVALVYLIMERQVKGKRFGLLFSRLPPLQVLDDLNRRLIVWGFIALSLTMISGAFFASPQAGLTWAWEPKQVATLVGWLVFGALLNARVFAGWQGRRVAVLTMAGFAILAVSFLSAFNPGAAGIQ